MAEEQADFDSLTATTQAQPVTSTQVKLAGPQKQKPAQVSLNISKEYKSIK